MTTENIVSEAIIEQNLKQFLLVLSVSSDGVTGELKVKLDNSFKLWVKKR